MLPVASTVGVALLCLIGVLILARLRALTSARAAVPGEPVQRRKLPKRIILMRHGESSGNVDESVYSHVPDWRVRLSATGHAQAIQTGRQLQQLIGSEPTIFYVSPYYRTRETFANVILQLNPTQVLDVRMEPRLREQDFGNFQCSDRMALAKSERGLFGRFFYRFPNGESGADVYDRVSTFLETLARDIQSESLGGDTNV
ncbi:histidine phosphatase superfamily, partial [Pavlovales sp. CCMP2436]